MTDEAAFDRVQRVADRIAHDWLVEDNVVQVAPCLKVTNGVVRPEGLAIGFHVRHKLSAEALAERGWREVPPEIDGIPTDVISVHQLPLGSVDERATRSAMFDTLVGGVAVGNSGINAYGTMGMMLLANEDDRMVGLTNEHVLVFDVDGKAGRRCAAATVLPAVRGRARVRIVLPWRPAAVPRRRQPDCPRRRCGVRRSRDRRSRLRSHRPTSARSRRNADRP
jgi:hypothetical protein